MDEKLAQAIADLQKAGGVTLGSEPQGSDVGEYISTQCPMLNYIIGRPGIPVGRVTTIYGREGTGKTTVGLHILAETQRTGGTAVLVDAERRHWRQRSINLGIDMEELIQLQGDTLEANFALILALLTKVEEAKVEAHLTILYDSVAGSATKSDFENKDSATPAKYARPVRQFLRTVTPILQRTNTTLVLVNHTIANLQFFGFNPTAGDTMPAAHPLGFFSSLKIGLKMKETLGPKEAPTGVTIEARIDDSRISPPKKKGEFQLDYEKGIDYADSALDVAVAVGLIEELKGWFRYPGIDKPFRRSDFAGVLEESTVIRSQIEAAPLLWTAGG